MTGLNPLRDYIIEIATIVTDLELNVLAEGPMVAIYQPERVLLEMDGWNTTHHLRSGLMDRVLESTYSVADAERMTLDFLDELVIADQSPMCGNGICQDRRFLHRLMPDLEVYFSYRNLDVSTIKELVNRWYPGTSKFIKQSKHLAMADIRESIDELKFYRTHFFIA